MNRRRLLLLLAILFLAAGIVILLQVVSGPTTPVSTTQIGFECLYNTTGQSIGAKLKVVSTSPQRWWDFECPDLASALAHTQRINTQWCVGGSAASPSVTLGDNTIDPFQETTGTMRRAIRYTGRTAAGIRQADGVYVFPCTPDVPALITALGQAHSGCCL